MKKATKQPNGTYDRFDEHLEHGDRVLKSRFADSMREYIFKEVTDDGYVRFEDLFGHEQSTLASKWQDAWENGDIAIPGDELTEVSGVKSRHAEALRDAGYESIDDLKDADQWELADVEGIGNALSARIKADVGPINPFELEPLDDTEEIVRTGNEKRFHNEADDCGLRGRYVPLNTVDPKGDDSLQLQMFLNDVYDRAKESDDPVDAIEDLWTSDDSDSASRHAFVGGSSRMGRQSSKDRMKRIYAALGVDVAELPDDMEADGDC